MKHCSFLVAALWSAALWGQIALAQPAKTPVAKTQPTVPVEAQVMMAPGAVTIYFARLPIGAKGAPILFHAWRLARRSPQTVSGANAPFLVCLDFFTNPTGSAGKWELVATTSYLSFGGDYPGAISYTTHWLQPKTQQGLVIVEQNSQQTGATIRLITLPQGVGHGPLEEYNFPHAYIQEFHASYSGGESIFIDFGHDAQGQMTVEEKIQPHVAVPPIHNTYAWNGATWAKPASHKM